MLEAFCCVVFSTPDRPRTAPCSDHLRRPLHFRTPHEHHHLAEDAFETAPQTQRESGHQPNSFVTLCWRVSLSRRSPAFRQSFVRTSDTHHTHPLNRSTRRYEKVYARVRIRAIGQTLL